jgi:hypothetical protein
LKQSTAHKGSRPHIEECNIVTWPERASVSGPIKTVHPKELGDCLSGRIVGSVVTRSYRLRKSAVDIPPNRSLALLWLGFPGVHNYSVIVSHAVDDAYVTLKRELCNGYVRTDPWSNFRYRSILMRCEVEIRNTLRICSTLTSAVTKRLHPFNIERSCPAAVSLVFLLVLSSVINRMSLLKKSF